MQNSLTLYRKRCTFQSENTKRLLKTTSITCTQSIRNNFVLEVTFVFEECIHTSITKKSTLLPIHVLEDHTVYLDQALLLVLRFALLDSSARLDRLYRPKPLLEPLPQRQGQSILLSVILAFSHFDMRLMHA